MNKLFTPLLCMLACSAYALTEAEFEEIYKRTDKDAEACYKLYEAYRDGDGVKQNDTCARKWLLGAHKNGKPVYNEIAELPWRKQAKLKAGRKLTPRFSEETILKKSEELGQVVDLEHPEIKYMYNDADTYTSKDVSDAMNKLVRKMLSSGADPNAACKNGTSVLSNCLGNKKLVRLLLEAGADLHARNSSAIDAALTYVGPSSDDKLNAQAKKNRQKAIKAHLASVSFLLKNGMDVKMHDTTGATMLCIACFRGAPETVEMLCKAGADPNQKCSKYEIAFPISTVTYYNSLMGIVDGTTPLLYSVFASKKGMVQALLRCGADPELPNDKGVTPLECARDNLSKEDRPEYRAKIEEIITILEEAIAQKNNISDSTNSDSSSDNKKKKNKKKR